MSRKTLWIAGLAAVLAMALGASVAYGRISDIFESAHDLGSPGNPTCRQCHTPHKAKGLFLWARAPATGRSGIQSLCLSCHDGSVTSVGWYVMDPNYVNHPIQPDTEDQDCDLCHNPHEGGSWKFLREYTPSGSPMLRNANVCNTCHAADVGPKGLSIGAISHPVDKSIDTAIDRQWNPYATPPDLSGTRLWDETGRHVVSSGPGQVKCETCHTVHGAQAGTTSFDFDDGTQGDITTLNTMPYSQQKYSPICQNCHQ